MIDQIGPVAELRPIDVEALPKSTEARHAELERAGHIYAVQTTPSQPRFPLGVRRVGAVKRFLEDRD